jgi:hypothetical protein
MIRIFQRLTWQKPWSYREGFLISLSLLILGLLLNQFSGSNLQLPGWPFNLILGILFLTFIVLVGTFYKKSYLIRWLSGIPACIPAITLFAVLTLGMGLIPQSESKDIPALLFKINYLKQSWLFLISTIYLLTCLGLVITRRAYPFTFRNVGLIVSHLGLWLIVMTAGLASSDLERYQVAVEEGKSASEGLNLDYQTKVLPFSIKLIDFSIDEFPAKLALVDIESNLIDPKIKNNLTLIENNISFRIKDFEIKILKYYPLAVEDNNSIFRPTHDSDATQAVLIRSVNLTSNDTLQGWICSGSPKTKASYLRVDSNYFFALTLPEPKRFSSKIVLTDSKGYSKTVRIEVNKPFSIEGWKLYQIGYDKNMGKYSTLSVIEAVRDPWISLVYVGIFLMILGAAYMFWTGRAKSM